CQHQNDEATAEEFLDCYMGEYEDEEDFVYRMWEDAGTLKQLEEIGINEFYIDWSAVARDWFIDSYFSVEVGYKETYVFSR
ncbi:MAG: antirestriction protein ArdA, partial [Richelia sp. RM2_1_2]|nr:antirestriction protein ArdA [Richelia sp. RM2_1_2]